MSILRSLIVLTIGFSFFGVASPADAQEIDQTKLEAAKKAAYEAYLPKEVLEDKPVKPANVDGGTKDR